MTLFHLSPSSRHRALAVSLAVLLAGGLGACGDSPAPTPAATGASSASSSAAGSPDPAASSAAEAPHLVDVHGRQVAFYVTPGRLPAVVLDAGGGEDHSAWKDLAPRIAHDTGSMVITYDRAGMGASDEVPGPWDVQSAVVDLETGLRELGVTSDVVLVAHSQAGEVATNFARANPQWLSGAVLVDANLPQFFTDEEIARIVAANGPQIEELKKQPQTKATRQLIATASNFGPAHEAYHRVSWPDTVPVTVMVSGRTPFDGSPDDAQRWRDAAAAFTKAGPGRDLVTAEGSSHNIPLDQPDLVLDEVKTAVASS